MQLVNLFSRRTAAVALAPLLALGALAPTVPAAEASTVATNSYVCTSVIHPDNPSWPIDLTIETTGWEGLDTVPAGRNDWPELSFENHLTIPEGAFAALTDQDVETIEVTGLRMDWSDGSQGPEMTPVGGWYHDPILINLSDFDANSDGSRSVDFSAWDDTDLFPKQAGEYDVLSPPEVGLRFAGEFRSCPLAPGATPESVHHVELFKTASTTSARTRKVSLVGDPVKVKVEVGSDWLYWADGPVKLVDKAGHTLDQATLTKAKAVLTVGQLPVGTHVLKVVYAGGGRYFGSRTKVKFQVRRR